MNIYNKGGCDSSNLFYLFILVPAISLMTLWLTRQIKPLAPGTLLKKEIQMFYSVTKSNVVTWEMGTEAEAGTVCNPIIRFGAHSY